MSTPTGITQSDVAQDKVILNGAFLKQISLLIFPVALQMLLQSMLGMADVIMVGELGDVAIAAVGLAAKIHFLLIVCMMGLATSASILVAQFYGAGKVSEYREVVAKVLVVGSWIMLPLSILLYSSVDYWMAWITPDSQVSELAAVYMRITAPTLIFMQIVSIYEGSFRAIGNTAFPFVASTIAVALNIILNYILIFGHFGFPPLGVEGAAWATLISRFVQLMIMLVWVYVRRHQFAVSVSEFLQVCRWSRVRGFLAFSSPVIGNHALWGIGNTVYHVLTGFAGTNALAVMGIIVPIEMCFLSIFFGVANASAVLVGQSLGADRPQYAWGLFRFFDAFAILLCIAMGFLLFLSRDVVVGMYANLTPQTKVLFLDILTVFCLCIWLKVLNLMRIVGVLRAGGDNRYCLKIDTIVMWGIGLPIFALAVGFGSFSFVFIYTLTFLEEAAKCIPVRIRIGKKKWLVNLTHKNEIVSDSSISNEGVRTS